MTDGDETARMVGAPAVELSGQVLIVDDEAPNRLYIRKLLGNRGCQVIEAADGLAACALARQHLPDLLLVDVVMPGMDGYEVCARIKRDPLTCDIPVIMVTAKTRIEDLEQGFDRGAMDYIRKPFNPRELVARVRNALLLKHANDALVRWKKIMSHELELAGTLQQSLLAMEPMFTPEMEIRKANQPCLQVGGDFFGLHTLPDGRIAIYMGDVCGHGVAPALVTTFLKASMAEAIELHADKGPHMIGNALHARFIANVVNPAQYATLFLGLFDPRELVWRCLSCGHPSPILLDAAGHPCDDVFERGGGSAIGMITRTETPFQLEDEVAFTAEPGSLLFMFTDGLIEAPARDSDEECGRERLTEIVGAVAADEASFDTPGDVLKKMQEQGYDTSRDDCSAITVHFYTPSEIAFQRSISANMADVNFAAAAAEAALLQHGWPDDMAAALQLLIIEHCSNIVLHGRSIQHQPIFLQILLRGATCRVRFVDSGQRWDAQRAFDRADLPEPTAEHGRGLPILKRLTRYMEHYRRDNRNMVQYIMDKNCARDAAHAPD